MWETNASFQTRCHLSKMNKYIFWWKISQNFPSKASGQFHICLCCSLTKHSSSKLAICYILVKDVNSVSKKITVSTPSKVLE